MKVDFLATLVPLWLVAMSSCTASPAPEPAGNGPLLAQASAQLTQIRPRKTIDPGVTKSQDLTTETAWWPITAEVSFRTTPDGVDMTFHAAVCRTAYGYPIRIYSESECTQIARDSKPWDGARGMLKAKGYCLGGPGVRLYESRSNKDPKPWSLGGPAASDLVGRLMVIHDPDTLEPLACGKIESVDAVAQPVATPAQRPRNLVVGQLAGLCGFGRSWATGDTGAGTACPDLDKLSDCALTHCVSGCLEICADYAACLDASTGVCTSSCRPNDACAACIGSPSQCMVGFCADELACAPPPTPGGPCTELRECCMRQGPLAEGCLEFVELDTRLGGDAICLTALSDLDFNGAVAFRSPCYPDAGAPMDGGVPMDADAPMP